MSMTSMNVSLPEEVKEYVEEQTKRRYSTPSGYVRELTCEDQKRHAKAKLHACCWRVSILVSPFQPMRSSGQN